MEATTPHDRPELPDRDRGLGPDVARWPDPAQYLVVLQTVEVWAYAGFAFAWIAAFVAHYLAKDGALTLIPLMLLVLLVVSYVTRPASRQWQAKVATT